VVQDFITRFMTFQGVNDVVAEELPSSPGMDELFSLLKVKGYAERRAYDVIVSTPRPRARPSACSPCPRC
jgi:anion-transporting  ArsA/GET3 family ATPase